MSNTSFNAQSPEEYIDFTLGTDAMHLLDFASSPLSWLWPGYIPFGALTLLEGAPRVGKSHVIADIIARVTSGRPFPDGSPVEAGRVLIVSIDGNLQNTLFPQLEAMHANLENIATIHIVSPLDEEVTSDNVTRFSFSQLDFSMLVKAMSKIRPKLIVFDPIYTLLRQRGSFGTKKIMPWLEDLEAFCIQFNCACLMVRSCKVKSEDARHIMPLERSPLFWRSAQSVLFVGHHPSAPDYSFLSCSKQRTAALPPTLRFYITNSSENRSLSVVQWDQQSPFTASDLFKPRWASSFSPGLHRQRILDVLCEAYPSHLTPADIHRLLPNIQLANLTQTLRRMYLDQQITKDTHGQYKANPIQPPRLHLSAPIPPADAPEQEADHLPLAAEHHQPEHHEAEVVQTLSITNEQPHIQEPILALASTAANSSPPSVHASKPKPKLHRSQTKARSRPNSKHRRK